MVDITVTVDGGDINKLQRRLKIVARKIRNPRKANRQVSIWLLRWINENFKSQGGKVGGWKPFKLGGRRLPGGQIDRSAKLLQDTGHLRQSFKHSYGRTFAEVGTNLSYAVTHEFGLPHKNLPARRMLPIGSDTSIQRGVVRIYSLFIKRAIR